MRILHVSYSRAGGIGNVVSELIKAQIQVGHNADWEFLTTGPLQGEALRHPVETLRAGLDDVALRDRNFQGPISSVRSGAILARRVATKLNQYDVIHFHGGTLTLAPIADLGTSAKIVVSHHDMRLVTGACHQSLGCNGYQENCSSCPALRSPFKQRAVQNRMESFPARWKHTAPSSRFARLIGESSLLSGKSLTVVPNPLPEELVRYQPTGTNNEFLTIVGSSAASKLRRIPHDQLEKLSRLASRLGLKLISIGGNAYEPSLVQNLGVLNRIQSFDLMSRSRLCMTPTKFESFSSAGLEALYLGAQLIAPLDSPQGELAEELNLRFDMDDHGGHDANLEPRPSSQKHLFENFGLNRVQQKFEEVYLDA